MCIEDVVRELSTSPVFLAGTAAGIFAVGGYLLGRFHSSRLHSELETAMLIKYDWTKEYPARTIRQAMKLDGEPSTLTVKVEQVRELSGGYTGHISDIISIADFFLFYKVGQRPRDAIQERGVPILLYHKQSGTDEIVIKAYYDKQHSCFIIGQMSGTVKGTKHEITLLS